jgi:hypothetical protein
MSGITVRRPKSTQRIDGLQNRKFLEHDAQSMRILLLERDAVPQPIPGDG